MPSSIKIPDFGFKSVNIDGKTFLEFKSDSGEAILSDRSVEIWDIKVHVGNDILIEGTSKKEIANREYFCLNLISDGWELYISKCMIYNTVWSLNSFKAQGLEIKANNGKIQDDGLVKQYIVLENLKFNDNGPISFSSDLLKGLELIKDELSAFPNSTGFFVFEDTYNSIGTKWKNIFDNFYFLLSFFSSNFVSLRISFIEGSDYKEFRVTPLNETSGNGHSIFYERYPFELSKFLNSTYDKYVSLKNKLNLKLVINYYIWMKNQSYIESRYLLGCILLETLKYGYAAHYKKYEKKKDYFYKSGTEERYSFKDLIYEIFSEFDIDVNKLQSWVDKIDDGFYYMRSDLNKYLNKYYIDNLGVKINQCDNKLFNEICCSHNIQFKESFIEYLGKYRNEVVHTGKIEATYPDIEKNLDYLERSIEILLLKILEVNCKYWNPPKDDYSDSLDLLDLMK